MRSWLLPLLAVASLAGCRDDVSDLQQFITETKANYKGPAIPMPEVKPFQHEVYVASELRSPFVEPKPELIVDDVDPARDCMTPDTSRVKEPLEAFSLESLQMRGTVGDAQGLWALITTTDGSLYRVRVGYHLGLFHGLITQVRRDGLDLVELVPDGSGCWTERYSELPLLQK